MSKLCLKLFDTDTSVLFDEHSFKYRFITTNEKCGVIDSYPITPTLPNVSTVVSSISILTTSACNMQCKYCYHGNTATTTNLTLQRLMLAISKLDLNQDSLHISFIGGEPLINFDLIHNAVTYFKSIHKHVSFAITTNGTMLLNPINVNTRYVDWLLKNRFAISISIDGPKEIHDDNRVFKNGNGSFVVIEKALDYVHKKYPSNYGNISFRATLYPTIKNTLKSRLIFFNTLIAKKFGYRFQIELVSEPKDGDTEEGLLRLLESQYKEAADWYIQETNNHSKVHWGDIYDNVLVPIINKTPKLSFCTAGTIYKSIDSNGDILACHRKVNCRIGSCLTGIDTIDESLWNNNRYVFRSKCQDCDIKFLCGGGCRGISACKFNNVKQVDSFSCAVQRLKIMTAFYILYKAKIK